VGLGGGPPTHQPQIRFNSIFLLKKV
jgi:hypothetical protein